MTTDGEPKRAGLLALVVVMALGAIVRGPFWIEALRTPVDGDTAIIGLMARHLGAGTTMWGQPYGSPVEAWIAAPFLALFGSTAATLRAVYFGLGLALIPAAWALARALDPRAALPAAVLAACPTPYLLLLAALPPPMYPAALLLSAIVLTLAIHGAARGRPSAVLLACAGAAAGLAVWTHLMTAPAILAAGVHLFAHTRRRRRLWIAALAMMATSAPLWMAVSASAPPTSAASVSGRRASVGDHLRVTVPALPRPIAGLLGTHVPLVADDVDHVVHAPRLVAVALIALWLLGLAIASRPARTHPAAWPLLAVIAAAILLFPFPLRSGPGTIRFLTPLYLPLVAIVAWGAVTRAGVRRAWVLVLALAALGLGASAPLLAAWRTADRAAAPFLLPDLAPVREALAARGIRRAYASYGPAYRLTFESGERIIASQPWNERFLHFPLPYLDEVRFASDVAWVLTPAIPSDLPDPRAFEEQLTAAGGKWQRDAAGAAIVYTRFEPPFSPVVVPLASAGAAGDGDPTTHLDPAPAKPLRFDLAEPVPLDAITLVAAGHGPPLPRSMDVEVSADGTTFDRVASRRRRGERGDLRWVNGHPQYVIDDDVLPIALGGRTVRAIRITPVASEDEWTLAEVLLHRAGDRGQWADWLAPDLDWTTRREQLDAAPRRDRADWYTRWVLVNRRR
jgi:4-amino-4-deoxy-L-arabinose transferase-like glycosyltransferase